MTKSQELYDILTSDQMNSKSLYAFAADCAERHMYRVTNLDVDGVLREALESARSDDKARRVAARRGMSRCLRRAASSGSQREAMRAIHAIRACTELDSLEAARKAASQAALANSDSPLGELEWQLEHLKKMVSDT